MAINDSKCLFPLRAYNICCHVAQILL